MDTEAVLEFLRDNDGEWTWWQAVRLRCGESRRRLCSLHHRGGERLRATFRAARRLS